ncbi:MAG: ABC transporter substrate-binding protein [Deltaproteobacteria bacterium]|nr:ABC transporter substrate-binding protein [Deltaproteobacteria bacterium]
MFCLSNRHCHSDHLPDFFRPGEKADCFGSRAALDRVGGFGGKKRRRRDEDCPRKDQILGVRRDKVPAIIGCWASSATLAAMPIMERNKIPLLVETATAPMITEKKNKWIFRFTSNNDIDGLLMEPYLVPKLGFKKVAYLAINNDWGRSMVKATSEIMKKTGGEVSLVEYCAGAEANFTPMLTRIKNSGADTMFITNTLNGIALILKQYHELGMKMNLFITSGMSVEELVHLAGKEAVEGAYFFERFVATAPPPGTEKESQDMVAAYKKMYPDGFAYADVAMGYDAVYIMAKAVQEAGAPDPLKIRDALEKTNYLGVSGRVKFDQNNHSQPRCLITQARNGVNTVVYILKRFTFVAAAYYPSTPHSSGFARLASGAFYEAIFLAIFYETIKIGNPKSIIPNSKRSCWEHWDFEILCLFWILCFEFRIFLNPARAGFAELSCQFAHDFICKRLKRRLFNEEKDGVLDSGYRNGGSDVPGGGDGPG